MKSSTAFLLAAGFVLWGMSSCSSTSTETTDTSVTTETVTPDMAAAEPVTSQPATTDTLATQGAATGSLAEDPTNFILLAGSLDLLEARSSREALAKATNADVKNYAQQVLSDHSIITQELKGLATTKQLKYPADLLPKHQLMLNRLTEESAKEFDKTYMELQEAAHSELEELFEDGSKRHSDPEMQAFASRNLPIMRAHLENTRKVKDMVD